MSLGDVQGFLDNRVKLDGGEFSSPITLVNVKLVRTATSSFVAVLVVECIHGVIDYLGCEGERTGVQAEPRAKFRHCALDEAEGYILGAGNTFRVFNRYPFQL
jgi:hypothetical protein